VGQALYALGISCGAIIAYGAYMAPGESLRRNVLAVVGSIFTVSLLATVIIFPLVFRYGLNPAQGPELVLQVLPVAFAQMPGGRFFGTLFFALLVLAALTPSVALLEVPVSWLCERSGMRRGRAALLTAAVVLALGQGSVQSYGSLAHWHPLASIPPVAQLTVFGLADYISANILMPLSALLVSGFVGWRLAARIPDAELSGLSPLMRRLLMLALRYLCPLGIAVVLLVGLWPS
jgi:NSS family neurotransmitter:Na+ symporter